MGRTAARRRPRPGTIAWIQISGISALFRAARSSDGRPSASSATTISTTATSGRRQAAMPAERSGQHREQRHQRVRQGGQRAGQPLMRLGDPFRRVARVGRMRVQAAPTATPRSCRAGGPRRCAQRPARSISFCRKVSMFSRPVWRIDLLAAAVDQQHPRAVRPVNQPPAFGQDGGVRGLSRASSTRMPRSDPSGVAGADINRQCRLRSA